MKAVPGRKTDVKDAEWLADLLRHGLLKASFIPPAPIRELRDLTRYRKSLVQERAQEVNRVQKVLETANVKLSSVATDVLGKSGQDMLQAIIEGTTDAEVLANLARGLLRKKLPQLQEALDGRVQTHHRILLKHILAHVAFLEQALKQIQHELEQRLPPFEEAMRLLMSISGDSGTLRCGSSRRNGGRDVPFSLSYALGVLGRSLPWEQAKRGQATQWQNEERQRGAAGCPC